MAARGRRWAVYLVAGMAGFGLCASIALIMLEGMIRLFAEPPQLIDIRALKELPGTNSAFEKKKGIRLYLTTETGRRMRPNTITIVTNHNLSKRQVVVETNSLGYRNRELGEKRDPRILFLGDSITLADYVDEQATIVRLVEQRSQSLAEPVETVNAGVGGVGLQTYFHILQETGLSVNPDIVVIGLYLNDFQSSHTIRLFYPPAILQRSWAVNFLFHAFSKRYATLTRNRGEWDDNMPRIPEAELEHWRNSVARTFALIEPAGAQNEAFKQRVLESIPDWGGAWSEEAWTRMSEVLSNIKSLLSKNGIKMVIILFPVSYQVEETALLNYPQRKARQVGLQLGVPFLDVLPALRVANGKSSEGLFYDHCHYTPYGNDLIAKEILEFLVRVRLIGVNIQPSASRKQTSVAS